MARYALGYLIVIVGGVTSQIVTDAVGATGVAAFGLLLAFGAVFVPAAAIVGGGPLPRGMAKTQQRQ